MPRSQNEIYEAGLRALVERLGRADMIRFLQKFETGQGDYARDRQDWVDRITLEEIEQAASGDSPNNGA